MKLGMSGPRFIGQHNMFESFKKMPIILKFLTIHAFWCLLMPITLFLPGVNHIINGQEVTVAELWATGLPIFQIFSGVALPICAWLMLKRKSYSRIIYLCALSVGMIVYYIAVGELGGVVSGVIVTSLIAAYLFMRTSVKEYFELGEMTT